MKRTALALHTIAIAVARILLRRDLKVSRVLERRVLPHFCATSALCPIFAKPHSRRLRILSVNHEPRGWYSSSTRIKQNKISGCRNCCWFSKIDIFQRCNVNRQRWRMSELQGSLHTPRLS